MEMVKTKLIVLLLCIGAFSGYAQSYEWSCEKVDGSMTGCVSMAKGDVDKTLGRSMEDGSYYSPNGTHFGATTATAKVAAIVNAAQPKMAKVKKVIAFSEEEMRTSMRESKISNLYVNIVMGKVSQLYGKKVDVGICNFGGIRMNMPAGNVILDDILSMFPFKNTLVCVEHKGSELKKIFEKMAAKRFEVVGGVEIVVENGKITKALIGGEPIDDNKIYSVATISFLLHGGDSLTLAENAEKVINYDVQIVEAVLEYIEDLKAQGKNITAPTDKYVTIK